MKEFLLSDDKTNLQIFPPSEREALVCMDFHINAAGYPRLSFSVADIAVDTTRKDENSCYRTTFSVKPEFDSYPTLKTR